ncbi:MAG: molybdate ABC transporter substrate-binding protein [Candidatus Limnocylindrales bacterium]
MTRTRTKPLIGLVLAAALVAAACGYGQGAGGARVPSGSGPGTARLTVLAAASLTDALAAATRSYQETHPGVSFTVATGASSALRVQVEQGAPADVFLSADTRNAEALVHGRLSIGPAVPFAGNVLAIVVPGANPARIGSPLDLARPGVRVVAAGSQVPITEYANRLVANLARLPGYPADFAARYAANVVSREDDVRSVLTEVELDEADAGIVYVTDALAAAQVRVIPVPASADVTATYDGVVVRGSPNAAAAAAFLAWLAGPPGQAILARFGFRSP